MKSSTHREPIAIVGIGCRFPGDIYDPQSFWNLLISKQNAIKEIPNNRWNKNRFFDALNSVEGRPYVTKGGFLDQIEKFDPGFFNISDREAHYIDPQQRLALELSWEAFEDGGVLPQHYNGKKVGVYLGLFMHDYGNLQSRREESRNQGIHSSTGMSTGIAANRISYFYNFSGPSLVIDTACSSSLVAINLACQDLWLNETELALAGGLNIILLPETTNILCEASMLSPSGESRPFDKDANGYVRSEGAGIVILKPLEAAIRDQNIIYSIIRSSKTNQDGKSSGLTVPNGQAQQQLIKETLELSGYKPFEIQYVEAHGTGTSVGDPIEAESIGRVYSDSRSQDLPCIVGSIKSNIGHTESAAGIAGLIKTSLMLKYKTILPNINFDHPNSAIDFSKSKVRIPTDLEHWEENGKNPRLAAVNSFGFGGTNSHIILEEYQNPLSHMDPTKQIEKNEHEVKTQFIPVSANCRESLISRVKQLYDFLQHNDNSKNSLKLYDLAYSASILRTHLSERAVFVSGSFTDLKEKLSKFNLERKQKGIINGKGLFHSRPKLAFVFSGMGQQWIGMGKNLIHHEPVFKRVIQECDKKLKRLTHKFSILEQLQADKRHSRIHETDVAQPCIFALQVALVELWKSWGIEPDGIIGHSVGEIAACYSAGLLSLDDAILVTYHRSRLQQKMSGLGLMVAVGMSEIATRKLIGSSYTTISIAAINSPKSVTISGSTEEITHFVKILERDQVFHKRLNVDVPYHSILMDSILSELDDSISQIKTRSRQVDCISTVTGDYIDEHEFNSTYWQRNVREPVLFEKGFKLLVDEGYQYFLEIGAQPVLAMPMRECIGKTNKPCEIIPSLRQNEPEDQSLLSTLGKLHCDGFPIELSQLFKQQPQKKIRFPNYPWNYKTYWNESAASLKYRTQAPEHPLLGDRIDSANPTWSNEIHTSLLPYLKSHKIQEGIIFPGAAYLEMGLAAARLLSNNIFITLKNITIENIFALEIEKSYPIQLTIENNELFSIHSRSSVESIDWRLHTRGKIVTGVQDDHQMPFDISYDDLEKIDIDGIYNHFKQQQLNYGPEFRNISELWKSSSASFGIFNFNDTVLQDFDDYLIHPAILDSAFQVMAAIPENGTFIPSSIELLKLLNSSQIPSNCIVVIKEFDSNTIIGDIQIRNEKNELLLYVEGLRCRKIHDNKAAETFNLDEHLYEDCWIEQTLLSEQTNAKQTEKANLPTISSLKDSADSILPELYKEYGRETYYENVEPDLNTLCTQFVHQMLVNAANRIESTHFTFQELVASIKVSENHILYFNTLLAFSIKNGILRKENDNYHIISYGGDIQKFQFLDPRFTAEKILIQRFGAKLQAILSAGIDPLELMFADENAIVEQLYQNSPSFLFYNQIAEHILKTVLTSKTRKGIRILEIGAGTGATTVSILPLLVREDDNYCFTDISPSFLGHAKKKFDEYQNVEYKTLNIEDDLKKQGFEASSFDIVIASDVLHATGNLKQSLKNTLSLLKANGMLILIELNIPPFWIDFIFGTLKGWWKYRQDGLRENHPTVTAEKWCNLLSEAGFSTIECIQDNKEKSFRNIILGKKHQSFITNPVGKTTESNLEEKDPQKTPWVIFINDSKAAENFVDKLNDYHIRIIRVINGERFKKISTDLYEIAFNQKEDIQILFNLIYPNVEERPFIINFCNVGICFNPTDEKSLYEKTEEISLFSLYLYQTMMQRNWVSSPYLWNITNGVYKISDFEDSNLNLCQSLLSGLHRVAINESTKLKVRSIDLSYKINSLELSALIKELFSGSDEEEIALRGDNRFVQRLSRFNLSNNQPGEIGEACTLYAKKGQIKGRYYYKAFEVPPCSANEVKVRVYNVSSCQKTIFAPFTDQEEVFVDSLKNSQNILGFSGTIIDVGENVMNFGLGDVVMGITTDNVSNEFNVHFELISEIPKGQSLESSSVIPEPYLAAYYVFFILNSPKPGTRVFIDNTALPYGAALVEIASYLNLEIIAQTNDIDNAVMLEHRGIQTILESKTGNVNKNLLRLVKNDSIDFVIHVSNRINTESYSKILKKSGKHIIIFEDMDIHDLQLRKFLKNGGSVSTINLKEIIIHHPEIVQSCLKKIGLMLELNQISPLGLIFYPSTQIDFAIRKMTEKPQAYATCLSLKDLNLIIENPIQPIRLSTNATYLITGASRGFGLSTTDWLVERGAQHIVILGRSAKGYQETDNMVDKHKNNNINITYLSCDVSDIKLLKEIIDVIENTMPPLKGIIHSAMVLEKSELKNMTRSEFCNVTRPKLNGAWNLHQLTLEHDLDFFVLFSSMMSLIGLPTQANYAAANSFLDGLAHYRQSIGHPALSINWGAIAETGYTSRHSEESDLLKRYGFGSITLQQAWKALDLGLTKGICKFGVVPIDWSKTRMVLPSISLSKRYQSFNKENKVILDGINNKCASNHFKEPLQPNNQKENHFIEIIRNEVAKTLSQDPESLNDTTPFEKLNFDSLMAVELGIKIYNELKVDIPKVVILQPDTTIKRLASIVRKQFQVQSNSVKSAGVNVNVIRSFPEDIDLHEEINLPKQVYPSIHSTQFFNPNPKSLFLTGATGFLGGYLLKELANFKQAKIYCLVRARSEEHAMQRIKSNLTHHGLWEEQLTASIIPVCGDLSKEKLGLSQQTWRKLENEVDVIYHNGAWLSFAQPYSALKATNVGGTIEIIKLACQKKTKPVHYVSTLIKMAQTALNPKQIVDRSSTMYSKNAYDDVYISRNGFNLGYHQSKWVAEELIIAAEQRGLPTTIYRPSLISGHSESGIWSSKDYTCQLIKGCIEFGFAPTQDMMLDLCPVDYVSKSIAFLSQKENSIGKGFILKNHSPFAWNDLIDSLNSLGYSIQLIDPNSWLEKLFEYVRQKPGSILYNLSPLFELRPKDRLIIGYPNYIKSLDNLDRLITQKALKNSSIICKPCNSELLKLYVNEMIKTDFLSLPQFVN